MPLNNYQVSDRQIYPEKTTGIIRSSIELIFINALLPGQPEHFEAYWGVMGPWPMWQAIRSTESLSVSLKDGKHPQQEAGLQLKNLNEPDFYLLQPKRNNHPAES
ncbi:MAG: hypothetical protein ABJB86_12090 [Bacteroidota bacterium]